jgi:hypothetical protein
VVKENERFFDTFEYSEAEFADYMAQLRLNGVDRLVANKLAVLAPGGMQVQVSSGVAFAAGFHYSQPSAINIAVDPNDEDDIRRDYVVLRLQRNLNNFILTVLKGTPGPFADPPDIERSFSYYDLVLAYIDVPIGVGTITSGMLHDARNDPDLCGWSGYGVFQDLKRLGFPTTPGVAFQTSPLTGLGWDGDAGRLLLYNGGFVPLAVEVARVLTFYPFMAIGEPAMSSPYTTQVPDVAGSVNAGVQSWDRRYQFMMGRSAVTTQTVNGVTSTSRIGTAVWGFRVGSSEDGAGDKGFELYDLGRVATGTEHFNSTGRPDATSVPLAFDGFGHVLINSVSGSAGAGAAFPHALSITDTRVNHSALNLNARSLIASTYPSISLMLNIGTPVTGHPADEPAVKRVPGVAEGTLGLVYGYGAYGSQPQSGTAFYIGPEGVMSNGIRMDRDGQVGVGWMPSFPFDCLGSSRFGGSVIGLPQATTSMRVNSLLYINAAMISENGDIIDSGSNVVIGNNTLPKYLIVHKNIKAGASMTAHQVAFECMQDAIFYGDVNIRGRLTFGTGGGSGSVIEFPADVSITGTLTVAGNGWFKSALRVDGDLDIYGFVRFHHQGSTSPYDFEVSGNQHIAQTLNVSGNVRGDQGFFIGEPTTTVQKFVPGQYSEVHGNWGVRLYQHAGEHVDGVFACGFENANWCGAGGGESNPLSGNLGHPPWEGGASRWTRVWSLYSESPSQLSQLSQMAIASPLRLTVGEGEDATEVVLPGSEMMGMRPYSSEEGLQAALRTPIATFFMGHASAMVTSPSADDQASLSEASQEMHLNVYGGPIPPEVAAPGASVSPLATSLVAIAAIQALSRRNQDLEQRLSDLERLVASLVPPAQA